MKDGHTVCSRATAAVYMDAAGKKYYFSKKLQNLKFLLLYQKNNQFKTNTFRKGESKICSSYLDIRTGKRVPFVLSVFLVHETNAAATRRKLSTVFNKLHPWINTNDDTFNRRLFNFRLLTL